MTARISVLHFLNSVARGGAEEHVLTLLRGLDRSRFRPLLVCPPVLTALIGDDVPSDVPIVPISLRGPREIGAAFALARLLRRERVDVLHAHLFYGSLFASPVGRMAGVPLIVETPHVPERWRRGLKARHVVDRLVGRLVDVYIAVSEANRRHLVEQKRLPAHKIVTVRNGCDVDRFQPGRGTPARLRAALDLFADDAVLMVVGRLVPQKGHGVLLDALPAVRRSFPRARLVCVGDGDLRPALEAQARDLGLAEVVHFVGRQPNVPDWLALADVVVLPSYYEGLPLAAIEALAAGRALVATAVDGTPEVVVSGETGLTVPPGDPGALATAICRLLDAPDLRRRLGAAGRRLAVTAFSQEGQVRQTEAVYAEGLRRRQGAAAFRLDADHRVAHGESGR